MVAMVTLYFPI